MAMNDSSSSIDVREHTRAVGGRPARAVNRRLFMQLVAYECRDSLDPAQALQTLAGALDEQRASAVIYADVSNPRGMALLSWSEDPADFVTRVRPSSTRPGLERLQPLRELGMLGRTYATGFEPDLEHWLIQRPQDTVRNPEWPWAIWYPLRRSGSFELLAERDKGEILREHAEIGKAYGNSDLAHDVRLACHGLDASDNEFVLGLCGKELHPLSHLVQAMRKTTQTARYIAQMGPFFVGYRVWCSAASSRP
jgi:chlorite dismutase